MTMLYPNHCYMYTGNEVCYKGAAIVRPPDKIDQ